MKRFIPAKLALFVATIFLGTGCTQQYLVSSDADYITQQPVTYQSPTSYNPEQSVTTNMTSVDIECSDEVSPHESNCDRGEIRADKLTAKSTQRTSSGVVHSLKSIQGHQIKVIEQPTGFLFPNYRGKTIILVIFGKDCPYCTDEIPILKSLKQRYRGEVEVIAIQAQERMSPHIAKNYINKHRINYPIIEGDDATELQYFIQNSYGWTGVLPFTMVIKDGITEFTYPGAISRNEIRADMDSLF